MYEIEIDGKKYYARENDTIKHNGEVLRVKDLI